MSFCIQWKPPQAILAFPDNERKLAATQPKFEGRWRLLDEEEADVVRSISARENGAQDGEAELQERLRVIEARRRVVPSLRRAGWESKGRGRQPPQYAP
jgi:hypothetical protein